MGLTMGKGGESAILGEEDEEGSLDAEALSFFPTTIKYLDLSSLNSTTTRNAQRYQSWSVRSTRLSPIC